jgi:hypothetical protein
MFLFPPQSQQAAGPSLSRCALIVVPDVHDLVLVHVELHAPDYNPAGPLSPSRS